jgi:hypothetical protein
LAQNLRLVPAPVRAALVRLVALVPLARGLLLAAPEVRLVSLLVPGLRVLLGSRLGFVVLGVSVFNRLFLFILCSVLLLVFLLVFAFLVVYFFFLLLIWSREGARLEP